MASLIVACPKCTKRQEVGAAIPPEGLRYTCLYCSAQFMVKLPPAKVAAPAPAASPPIPDLDDLLPTSASSGRPAPPRAMTMAGMGKPPPPAASRATMAGMGKPPVAPPARESIPLFDDGEIDLPAPRDAMPRPDDLLMDPNELPGPDDLLAPRESMPRPDDLLASRDAMPRSDDLLMSRDVLPRSDDLLSPLEARGLPENLPGPQWGTSPAPGAPVPAPIPNLFKASQSLGTSATMAPSPGALTGRQQGAPSIDLFGDLEAPGGMSPLEPLNLGTPGPAMGGAAPPPQMEAQAPSTEDQGDAAGMGLSLELDTPGMLPEMGGGGTAEPQPLAMDTPSDPDAEQLPGLAPVSPRRTRGARPARQPISKRKILTIAGGTLAGLAALGAGAFFLFIKDPKAPPPAQVLGAALNAEVARDDYGAYLRAGDVLVGKAGQLQGDMSPLKAAGAEHWLLGVVVHGGDKTRIAKADQLLGALPKAEKTPPAVARARALVAVAKEKPAEVIRSLGAEAATAEGQLVLALRDLQDGKNETAAKYLRGVRAMRPSLLVAPYLLGRALEATNAAEAAKAYGDVLAKNPNHFGAALGAARLEATPEKRLVAINDLLKKGEAKAATGELADAYVALGRAAQGLAQTAEATAAFTRALAKDPSSVAANLALGDANLIEGRYQDALARFKATGAAGLKLVDGKFGLGGAMIGTGKIQEGLALVEQAGKQSTKDPRTPFWNGFAAESATTPDLEGAAQKYRESLQVDPKFLPASLKLAALLQRQGKPQDALTVLSDAEKAGTAPTLLQLAWGDALVVAKEPAKAEVVFRKVLAGDPKLVAGYLGLVAAQEIGGNLQAGKETLEKALVEVPGGPGLRERLAGLNWKLGLKEEAIAVYKAEIATGKASLPLRVQAAKLTLELGRADEAREALDKIVSESPVVPEALFTLARSWEIKGDLVKALQTYRKAQVFDRTPQLNLAFARLLHRLKYEQETMRAYDAAADLPEARMDRGRIFFKKGLYDKALADFVEAGRLWPTAAEPVMWQGLSQDRLGQGEQAALQLKNSLRMEPTLADPNYHLGRMELDHGRPAAALDYFRKAAKLMNGKEEWTVDLYFQLGSVEKTNGTRPAAIAAFKKYLEVAPNEAPSRPEAVQQLLRLGVQPEGKQVLRNDSLGGRRR